MIDILYSMLMIVLIITCLVLGFYLITMIALDVDSYFE